MLGHGASQSKQTFQGTSNPALNPLSTPLCMLRVSWSLVSPSCCAMAATPTATCC
jgi:hypothetical protein